MAHTAHSTGPYTAVFGASVVRLAVAAARAALLAVANAVGCARLGPAHSRFHASRLPRMGSQRALTTRLEFPDARPASPLCQASPIMVRILRPGLDEAPEIQAEAVPPV